MTNIDNFAIAIEIIERADKENGGICFDSWHLTRSTNDIQDIKRIPQDKIFATQWNDGPLKKQHTDYYTDTLSTRVPPGEGEFELIAFIKALHEVGCEAPIGLEVPSTDLWAIPIEEAAEIVIQAMKNLLSLTKTS